MAGIMLDPRVTAPFVKFAARTNWHPPLHGIKVAELTFPFGKVPYESLLKLLGNEDPVITGDDDAARMLSAITQHDLITNRGWKILDMACSLADRYPSSQVPPDELDALLIEARNKTDAGLLAADVSLTILAAAGKTEWQEAAKAVLGEQFGPIFAGLFCELHNAVPDAMAAHDLLPSNGDDAVDARRMAHLIDTVLLKREMIREDVLGFSGAQQARDLPHWQERHQESVTAALYRALKGLATGRMPMADGAAHSAALVNFSLRLGEKLSDDEVTSVMQCMWVLRGFRAARENDIKGVQAALMSPNAMAQPAVRALWAELHIRLRAAKKSGPLLGAAKDAKILKAGANGEVTFEQADSAFDSGLFDLVRALGTAIPPRFYTSTNPSYDDGRRAIVGPALQQLIRRMILLDRTLFLAGITDCSDRPDIVKAGFVDMQLTDYANLSFHMLAIWSVVFTPWVYPPGQEPPDAVLAGPAADFPICVLWSRMLMAAHNRGFDRFNGERRIFLHDTIGTFVDKFASSLGDMLRSDPNASLTAAEVAPTISFLGDFFDPAKLQKLHFSMAIQLASPAAPAAGAAGKGKIRVKQQMGGVSKRRFLADADEPLPESASDADSDSADEDARASIVRLRRRKDEAKPNRRASKKQVAFQKQVASAAFDSTFPKIIRTQLQAPMPEHKKQYDGMRTLADIKSMFGRVNKLDYEVNANCFDELMFKSGCSNKLCKRIHPATYPQDALVWLVSTPFFSERILLHRSIKSRLRQKLRTLFKTDAVNDFDSDLEAYFNK